MQPMHGKAERLALAALALGLVLALGACAGAVAPTPPIVSGGAGSLARADDWGFGVRSQTRGYVFDRGGAA
jgi:hypothetical protein